MAIAAICISVFALCVNFYLMLGTRHICKAAEAAARKAREARQVKPWFGPGVSAQSSTPPSWDETTE